jgi:serine/threonine-protein kinase
MAGAYYFGLFSPFAALIAVGIYVHAMGERVQFALASYLNIAVSQGILGALIIAGVIPDVGLVSATALATREQVVLQLCVELVYAVAFAFGRMSRRHTIAAVTELEREVRRVAQRQALIEEARAALEGHSGAVARGRFSEQILGSFRLGALIGRGATGEVYEAVHQRTGETCAVKLLRRSFIAEPREVARFAREARIAARLSVPNVVRVLEVGGVGAPLPYIAMERLAGCNLGQYLDRLGRLPLSEVVDLVAQVAAGLEAARHAGIVHRDLKPQNLFGSERAGVMEWKIVDFGGATITHEASTLTQGLVIGTPSYMAPEQAQGRAVDHRADVYSLAVIAYRCLTGRAPFLGRDPAHLLYSVVHHAPPRPRALIDLPAEVELVLALGMAKRPHDRFATAGEFADAMQRATGAHLNESWRRRGAAQARAAGWMRA